MNNATADDSVWVCDWHPDSLDYTTSIVSSLPLVLLLIRYLIAGAASLNRNSIFSVPDGAIALHLFFLTLGLTILAVDTTAIFLAAHDEGRAHFLLTGAGMVKTGFTTSLLIWIWYHRRDGKSKQKKQVRLSWRNVQAFLTVGLVIALGAAHIPAFRSSKFLVNDPHYKRSAWLLILHGFLRFFGGIFILAFAWISLSPNCVPKVTSLKDAADQAACRDGQQLLAGDGSPSNAQESQAEATAITEEPVVTVVAESNVDKPRETPLAGRSSGNHSANSTASATTTANAYTMGAAGGDKHRTKGDEMPEVEHVSKCGCTSLCCPICWLSVFCDDDRRGGGSVEHNPGRTSVGYRAMTRVLVVHSLAVLTRAVLDFYDGSISLQRQAGYAWNEDERFAVEIVILDVPILALYLVAWRQAQPSPKFQTMSNHLLGIVSAVGFFVLLALMRVLVKANHFCSLDIPSPVAVGAILARAGAAVSFALIPPLYFSMLYGVFSLIESSRIGTITPRFHGSLAPIHGALGLALAAAIAVHIAGHARLRELASDLSPNQFAQVRNTSEVLANYIQGAKSLNDPYVAYPWITGIMITALLGLCVLSGLHEKSKVGSAFQRYHRWPAYYMLFGVAVHGLAAVLSPPLMYAVVLIFLGPALLTEHVLLRHFRRFASESDIVRLETFVAAPPSAHNEQQATENSHKLKETVYILRLKVPRETKVLGMDISRIRLVGGWTSTISRRLDWPQWIRQIRLDCILNPLNEWWIAARKKTVRNIFFAPFSVKPGQWVWLRIANYSDKTLRREWHPFTVARVQEEGDKLLLEFHIQACGNWTRGLSEFVPAERQNVFSNFGGGRRLPYVQVWGSFSSELGTPDIFNCSQFLGIGFTSGSTPFCAYFLDMRDKAYRAVEKRTDECFRLNKPTDPANDPWALIRPEEDKDGKVKKDDENKRRKKIFSFLRTRIMEFVFARVGEQKQPTTASPESSAAGTTAASAASTTPAAGTTAASTTAQATMTAPTTASTTPVAGTAAAPTPPGTMAAPSTASPPTAADEICALLKDTRDTEMKQYIQVAADTIETSNLPLRSADTTETSNLPSRSAAFNGRVVHLVDQLRIDVKESHPLLRNSSADKISVFIKVSGTADKKLGSYGTYLTHDLGLSQEALKSWPAPLNDQLQFTVVADQDQFHKELDNAIKDKVNVTTQDEHGFHVGVCASLDKLHNVLSEKFQYKTVRSANFFVEAFG